MKYASPLLALAAIAALAVHPQSGHAGGRQTAKVGQPAPGFTLKTFDGEKVSLESLRGQVVVLNFWATWCGPCKREMPMMDAYMRSHKDQGLRVFAVATEDSVPAYQLKPLAKLLSFPLVSRMSDSAYPVLTGVPTNYVIDRAGVVRYAKAAAFDQRSFDDLIGGLLREPAPAPAATPAATR